MNVGKKCRKVGCLGFKFYIEERMTGHGSRMKLNMNKINLKWIKDLYVRHKTIKFL